MSTQSTKKLLKELVGYVPADASAEIRRLDQYSDETAVLIASQLLSDALEGLILRLSRPDLSRGDREALFSDNGGPLATFSSRIRIAHALGGVGPETRADLDAIRSIRNAFAHPRQPLSFKTPAIAKICSELRLWRDPGGKVSDEVAAADARELFSLALFVIHWRIERYLPPVFRVFDFQAWQSGESTVLLPQPLYEDVTRRQEGYVVLDRSPPP